MLSSCVGEGDAGDATGVCLRSHPIAFKGAVLGERGQDLRALVRNWMIHHISLFDGKKDDGRGVLGTGSVEKP